MEYERGGGNEAPWRLIDRQRCRGWVLRWVLTTVGSAGNADGDTGDVARLQQGTS